VGIFAGDACALFEPTAGGACAAPATQLLSLTAMGQNCGRGATDSLGNPLPCAVVPVTSSQVRYITNAGTAQTVFGTPFGNAARNLSQDAITNTANFSVIKGVKMGEHASFEFRMSMLNALNHQNFQSVDAFIEDAGQHTAFSGFGDPSVTNTTYPGSNGATRRITFGGTIRF